jgi:hypothetical protein
MARPMRPVGWLRTDLRCGGERAVSDEIERRWQKGWRWQKGCSGMKFNHMERQEGVRTDEENQLVETDVSAMVPHLPC